MPRARSCRHPLDLALMQRRPHDERAPLIDHRPSSAARRQQHRRERGGAIKRRRRPRPRRGRRVIPHYCASCWSQRTILAVPPFSSFTQSMNVAPLLAE